MRVDCRQECEMADFVMYVYLCVGGIWPFPLLSHVLQLCRSISMQTAAAMLHPTAHFKRTRTHTHTHAHTRTHTQQ